MTKKIPATYKLTELLEALHQTKYPRANEQKIKWYAKQRVIFPQRFNPNNPKSKYLYSDKDLQELRILFTFMMVYPYESAKDMLSILRAYMELAHILADPVFVAALKQDTLADIKREPWATYHHYMSQVIGEEIRLDKDQIWDKIQDATEQITQAYKLLSIIHGDFMNAKIILDKPENEKLFRIYNEKNKTKR